MSAVQTPGAPAVQPVEPIAGTRSGLSSAQRIILFTLVGLILLSITRHITGARDLTNATTISSTLRTTMPIMLAGLAGLWAERIGIVNIGIEGMMIFGTWFGAVGAWQWGAWPGLLFGIIGGALGGLLHAVATVTFNVDHVISGVALNMLAFGSMRYASYVVFPNQQISKSPTQKSSIPEFNVPFLTGGEVFGWKSPNVLDWLTKRRWFIISDIANVFRGVFTGISAATILALALVGVTWFVLWRTRFGLRARSSGEAPSAAESLGVKVTPLRYAGLAISGGFAGLGGAYLSVVASSAYQQGQTSNKGFIGLATTIFGNWRPAGVLGGATLFGFSEALLRRREDSIPALFLFGTFLAGLLVILNLYRRKSVPALSAAAAAALFLFVYLSVDEFPTRLTQATPYVVTLVVLAVASQRLRPPAHAGLPYRSGDSH